MGKLDGKVAFITGVARGQGRSHAVRLAEEGADIIGVDICQQLQSVGYEMSTTADLEQTVKEVEALGRRIVAREADVRDSGALKAAFGEGVQELGPVQIVIANAGIGPGGMASSEQQWSEVIGVNLTGVWNTGRAGDPFHDQGRKWRCDRTDEFHRWPHRSADRRRRHVGLYGCKARRHRLDSVMGQFAGTTLHSCQQRRAHHRPHPDGGWRERR